MKAEDHPSKILGRRKNFEKILLVPIGECNTCVVSSDLSYLDTRDVKSEASDLSET
jgi:hypothetical protein